MLLDQKIEVNLNGRVNVNYYENLGYVIPRYIDRNGIKRIKKNTKIIVNINDLQSGSNIEVNVACDMCNKKHITKYHNYFNSIKKGGYYACSDCRAEKQKRLNILKYGVENVFQLESTKDKIKETSLLKYGVEYPMQSKEILDKVIETNMIKYGVQFHSQSSELMSTMRKNNLDKYGVEHVMQTDSYKEKSKNTMLEKYGVEHALQVNEFKDKFKNTSLQKFGTEYPSQNKLIRNKTEDTCIKKFGFKTPLLSPDIKSKISNTMYKNGSCKTSKQQSYINELYKGILNFPIRFYNLDIYMETDKIDIEYDGSGHDMCIYKGNMTEKQFKKKEITRNLYIKSLGMNQIHIISKTDKLPSDEILLDILSISKEYFNTTIHTWIEWYLDENKMRNAENKDGSFYDFGLLKRVS